MTRPFRTFLFAAAALASTAALPAPSPAAVGPDVAEKLYDRVTPSLVAVRYTWDFELRRQDLTGAGVVVTDDGLVMASLDLFNPMIPDAQMRDFKIIVPSRDGEHDEIEAEFLGRDERSQVAFLRPKAGGDAAKAAGKPAGAAAEDEKEGEKKDADGADTADGAGAKKSGAKKSGATKAAKKADADAPAAAASSSASAKPMKWTPIKFEDAPVRVGQPVLSVGLLPETAGFKTYFMESTISATLRGPVPQVMVSGAGLAAAGSPVFTVDGKAIGLVLSAGQRGSSLLAVGDQKQNAMSMVEQASNVFVPARDFLPSLASPPVAGQPLQLPWLGVAGMTGVSKELAEVYEIPGQPAIEIGEVVPDAPAAKAGLKQRNIVVTVNGKPLERGDEPEELPMILSRQVSRMKPGSEVTLGVIRKPGEKPQDVTVALGTQPKQQNLARRFYAEDLGFGVRELVFGDRFERRLASDAPGVLVSLIKPQSAAQTGGLQGNGSARSDIITQLNGQPVKDLEGFEQAYKAARKDKPKDALVLVVNRREGREDTVRIEPPQ